MIYPCFGLNTAYYVYYCTTDAVLVCQFLQFCNCLVSAKHDGFGKKALSICKNQLYCIMQYIGVS